MHDGSAKARLSVLVSLVLLSSANLARAQTTLQGISSRSAVVDGIKLHYLAAGRGPAVILRLTCRASGTPGSQKTAST